MSKAVVKKFYFSTHKQDKTYHFVRENPRGLKETEWTDKFYPISSTLALRWGSFQFSHSIPLSSVWSDPAFSINKCSFPWRCAFRLEENSYETILHYESK